MPLQVSREGNRIAIAGELGLLEFRRVLATVHDATAKRGFKDLVLDFEHCTAAFAGPMLALAAAAADLRRKGVDTKIVLPTKPALSRLFFNAGWAHLLDPIAHPESTFRGYTHVPAVRFASASEQKAAVDRMIDAVLCSLPELARGDLAAIEWSLNEITDNVMVHSQSELGGIVQLNNLLGAHGILYLSINGTSRVASSGVRARCVFGSS